MNYVSFGKRIRAARKGRGLTQQTLSEMIDCSPTFLSYVENGTRTVSLDMFVLLANALNTSTDELLADSLDIVQTVEQDDFIRIIADCDSREKQVLYDILYAAKQAIRGSEFQLK